MPSATGADDPQVLVIAFHGASVGEHHPPHIALALWKDSVHHGDVAIGHHDLVAHPHITHAPEPRGCQHQRVQRLGLSRTHLALEQAVHGVGGGEVVEDLAGDLLLALGEGEGEAVAEGREEAVRAGDAGHGGQVGLGVPAAGQGDLEDEGLVPLQAGAGVGDVGLGVRPVDLEQGLGEREQAAAGAQGVRERVEGLLGAGQHRLDRLADLPGLQFGGRGVDRDQGAGPGLDGLVTVAPQQLVGGVGELEAAVEDGDLAGEHGAGARQQFLVGFVHAVAEEDELEPAAAVRDRDLQALPLAPGCLGRGEAVQPGVGDLGDHRDVLVHGEVGEVGELAALLVSARVVVQQIADGVQAEVLGHHLRGGGAEHLLERFLQCGHATHCTPRH